MLDHWLFPLQARFLDAVAQTHPPFFQGLRRHSKSEFPELSRIRVALIAADTQSSYAIRKALYSLSFPFEHMSVADLGNLRRKSPTFAIGLLQELLQGNIIPLVLAPSPEMIEGVFDAFNDLRQHTCLGLVQQRPALHADELLGRLLQKRPFHLGLIGCQSHFMQPEEQKMLVNGPVDLVRLGQARANLQEVEPIVRDADLVGFDLGALRGSDAPEAADLTPSGFLLEEGCQIMRYAGLSDKLRAAAIVGYTHKPASLTAQAIAQLIWYFLDGVYQRKSDFPVSTAHMVEYIVEVKQLNYQLTFWKSSRSGRWWLQLPSREEAGAQRHRLVPCSYRDYQQAVEGELPHRLLQALKRYA